MLLLLPEQQVASKSPLPNSKSLTVIETRDWYKSNLKDINVVEKQLRNQRKSLKEIFETVTKLRNDVKLQARDLMEDQDLAKSLPPPQTIEEVLRKYNGNYEKAISASKRTNSGINKSIESRRLNGEE